MSSVPPSGDQPEPASTEERKTPQNTTKDQTAKATIRNTALKLFAESGYDGVSMRDIASEAGVSPALIVHHFGSKIGLKKAVDDHVTDLIVKLTNRASDPEVQEEIARTIAEHDSETSIYDNPAIADLYDSMDSPWGMLGDSPITSYIRRLLTEDDPAATMALASWHASVVNMLTTMDTQGQVHAGQDPALRAAILLAYDMSVLLLRGPLTRILGYDPMSKEGASQWVQESQRLLMGGMNPTGDNNTPDPTTPTTQKTANR